MKKLLLTLSLLLFLHVVLWAQQQTNFYATLFYNSTNNTITTTYFINNTANGNCNMKIAVLPLEMQWNPAVLTLQSFRFIPTGTKLDVWGEEYPDNPPKYNSDANNILQTKSVLGKTFNRRLYRRSTNLCDNTLDLPCGTFLPVFEAVFTFVSPALGASGYYDFVTPTATNYIGEFISNTDGTPSNSFKELIFVASRLFDQAGSNGTCPAGSTIGQINNVPNSQGGEVFVNTQYPLPVKMNYFEAFKQNGKAFLKWETLTELNSKGFVIERKTSSGFEEVGYVASKSTEGNSSKPLSYSFNETDPLAPGTSYYRLKQLSFSGQTSYSEIKAVRNSKGLQVMVYPNPNRGIVNIVVPAGGNTTDISMIDFSGKIIKTWSGYRIPNIQLNGLQKGIYSLVITNRETGEKAVEKITVQ